MKWLIFLWILLFASTSLAAELTNTYEIDSDFTVDDLQDQIQNQSNLAQDIQKLGVVNKQNLENVAAFIVNQMSQNQNFLIIVFILSQLSSLGMWWAIYLYLKSRKRI